MVRLPSLATWSVACMTMLACATPGCFLVSSLDELNGSSSHPCASGTKLCEGFCVSTSDAKFGCGSPSCTPCNADNATSTCSDDACAVVCDPGWANCDGEATNGCEVSLGPEAPSESAHVVTARAASPMIDGDYSDWPADWVPMFQQKPGTAETSIADLSARFRVAWDATALYVVVLAADDSIETGPSESHPLYEYDSFEVMIDGKNDKVSTFCSKASPGDDHQIFVSAEGVSHASCSTSGDGKIVTVAKRQPGCYVVEAAITWSFVDGNPPSAGADYGFTIDVNDRDDGARQSQLFWKFAAAWYESSLEYGTLSLAP